MTSTDDAPTNYINPELTWKAVTKGNRSESRRTRKPVGGDTMGELQVVDVAAKEVKGVAVSESEKLGVTVLGERFADRIEHVPIKKRRFLFQSTSPSPPQSLAVSENSTHIQHCSSPNSNGKHSNVSELKVDEIHGKTSRETDEKHCAVADFSGIEILASVACSSPMRDDIGACEGHVKQSSTFKIDLPTSTILMGEITLPPNVPSVSNDMVHEDKSKNPSRKDEYVAISSNSPANDCNRTAKNTESVRDKRLFLDLNVSAWEETGEFGCDNSHLENSDEVTARNKNVLKGLFDNERKLDECVLDQSGNNGGGPFLSANGNAHQGSTKVIGVDACPNTSDCSNKDTSSNGGNTIQRTEDGALSVEGQIICDTNVEAEKTDVASVTPALPKLNHEFESKICVKGAGLHDEKSPTHSTMLLDNYQVVDASLGVEPVSQIEVVNGPSTVEHEYIFKSCMDIQPSVNVETKEEVRIFSVPSAKIDSSGHNVSEGLLHDLTGNFSATQGVGVTNSHSSRLYDNGLTKNLDKVSIENHVSEDGSDSLRPNKDGTVSGENSLQIQVGYDSQFEDGELREEIDPHWEVDDGDIEQLDYGYESEDERLCQLAETTKKKMEETDKSLRKELDVDEKTDHSTGDDLRANSASMGTSKKNYGGQGENSAVHKDGSKVKFFSSAAVGSFHTIQRGRPDIVGVSSPWDEKDDCSGRLTGRDRLPSHMDERTLGGRRFLNSSTSEWDSKHRHPHIYDSAYDSGRPKPRRDIGSNRYAGSDYTVSRTAGVAGLDNHIQKQNFNYGSHRRPFRRRSPAERANSYDMHEGARDASPDRSRFRPFRWRSPADRDNSYDMHEGVGEASPDRSRLRRFTEGGRRGGFESRGRPRGGRINNHVRRQFISSSLNGVYQRRRSPSERDDTYGMGGENSPTRNIISPSRSRRYRGYADSVSRGPRPTMPEDLTEFAGRTHRFSRRERSNSPTGSGRPHYDDMAFKNCRSRSRSRSPVSWRRNRSPNFRPNNPRMVRRGGMSFQKRFAATEESFMSHPRNRFSSPHRNSRGFEDLKSSVDIYKGGRKSPVRTFSQSQRFDVLQLNDIGRESSDNFRPRRFHNMGRGRRGGRGFSRYEGSVEDKHGNRYDDMVEDRHGNRYDAVVEDRHGNRYDEMVHRQRLCDDTDGDTQQQGCKNKPEECLEANNES